MKAVEYRILGPLEVVVDGRTVDLGGRRQRALLAALLVRAGRAVSADELIEDVWGDGAPPTARAGLHVYLSRLRRVLGDGPDDGPVTRHRHGYVLAVEDGQLDAQRFQKLAAVGREALAGGDAHGARVLLDKALGLWRGPVLGDLPEEAFARSEARRLDDLRVAALEDGLEARLALGEAPELVAEAEALVREHPYRERLHGQLMLALYRSGRQADALEVYRRFHRSLRDELGLEPSPELAKLQGDILRHEAGPSASTPLAATPPVSRARPTRHTRLLIGAVLAVALGGAGATMLPHRDAEVRPRSLAVLDARDGSLRTDIPLGSTPSDVAVGRRAVFATVPATQTVLSVSPRTFATAAFGTPIRASRVTAAGGVIWLLDVRRRRVARLGGDRLYHVPDAAGRGAGLLEDIAVADGAAWLVERDAELLFRLDLRTGRTRNVENRGPDSFSEGPSPRGLAFGAGSVWSSNAVTAYPSSDRLGRIVRMDPATGETVKRIRLPAPPVAIAATENTVWVALERGDAVWRIDPRTDVAAPGADVAGGAIDIAVDGTTLWALGRGGRVTRIDADRGTVVETLDLGRPATAIAAGHGLVWVTIR